MRLARRRGVAVRLPESGRAAVVVAFDEPLELREYPIAEPPPGGLLVAVERTTVCGSDVHIWDGSFAEEFGIRLPVVLGHEIVGRIVAFGDGSRLDSVGRELGLGDRVTWEHEACGRCYECTVTRTPSLCRNRRIGFLLDSDEPPHFGGGFAEYSYVWPRSGRLRIPDDVDSALAAAASCALRTAIPAIERLGGVGFDDTVVVQGSGPLGLFATAVFATHRPRRLIVVGGPSERLEVARAWGADVTISIDEHPDREERVALVREQTEGRGATVVGEFSGGREAVVEGVEMTAPAGRYVIAGSLGGPAQPLLAQMITQKALTIHGSLGAEIGSYFKALEFLRQERDSFAWGSLLGATYDLSEASTALARMQAFEEIKAVLAPSG